MKIERDKLYRTRNGTICKIICTDRGGINPIVGYTVDTQTIFTWSEGGAIYPDCDSLLDLIAEVRSPREWLLTRSVTSNEWEVAPLTTVLPKDEFVTVRVREVLDEV